MNNVLAIWSIISKDKSRVKTQSIRLKNIFFFRLTNLESDTRWFLIGSSFGGLVATLVTQRQPQSIHSLLLLAPAFNPIERWTTKFDLTQWKSTGFLNYFNPITQSEEPISYQFFTDLQTHSAYPLVTTCPVTIIHGLHDDIVPIETSREYLKRLKSVNEHSISLIELDDDHHLRKKKTLNVIQNQIIQMHNRPSVL